MLAQMLAVQVVSSGNRRKRRPDSNGPSVGLQLDFFNHSSIRHLVHECRVAQLGDRLRHLAVRPCSTKYKSVWSARSPLSIVLFIAKQSAHVMNHS